MRPVPFRERALSYSERVPWIPTPRRLELGGGGATRLYTHRDEAGVSWWSDGYAIFRGDAPEDLRAAYRAAGRPVDIPHDPILLPYYASLAPGTRLGAPIATYEVSHEASPDVVPVAVFAFSHGPELHLDARYLAHAEAHYPGCTFWRIARSICAVRDAHGHTLLGVVEARMLPPRHGHGEAS
ncbi:MAG: hypothetical protein OXQ94_06910 [Gemmatimonadota bacterium]|nr:hypothetical protein [Gemmatimonadota bacterium]